MEKVFKFCGNENDKLRLNDFFDFIIILFTLIFIILF